MNELKKCSISGIAFNFEYEAYVKMSEYISTLKTTYKNNPDGAEIIADIEARIAELILSALSSSENTVCLPLVENIISQLGNAEQISENDNSESSQPTPNANRIARRLYRDTSTGRIGGVCTGLGKYFRIDPVWVRLAFLLPVILILSCGIIDWHWWENLCQLLLIFSVVIYILLWLAVPAAKSARQRLEMEGEAITAQSIGSQTAAMPEERARNSVASAVSILGKIFVVLIKIFVGLLAFPFIAACIMLIICIISIPLVDISSLVAFGNLGNLTEVTAAYGWWTPALCFLTLLIPTITILYIFIALIGNRHPKWWVLLISLIMWILSIVGATTSLIKPLKNGGLSRIIDFAESIDNTSDHNSHGGSILTPSTANALSEEELEALINDQNAPAIEVK